MCACAISQLNKSLCVLDLQGNKMGDDGQAIADILSENQTITYLNLNNNHLQQEGIMDIAGIYLFIFCLFAWF